MPVVLGTAGRAPHIKARFVYRGTANPFGHLPRFGAAAGAQSVLENNATGSAAINLIPDSDGVLRRVPLVFQLGDTLVPSMAAEVLRVTDGPLALSPCVSVMAYRKCEDCFEETVCAIRKALLAARDATAEILESRNLAQAAAQLKRSGAI